jgi:hypothetical protein
MNFLRFKAKVRFVAEQAERLDDEPLAMRLGAGDFLGL